QDMRHLRHDQVLVDQVRRREWGEAGPAFEILHQRLGPFLARAVAIGDAGAFQHQAHELPAARDVWPVPQVVAHYRASSAMLSPGAKARMASAWTRWPGISPSARLTM